MSTTSEEFDSTYDQGDYEEKISALVRGAYKRVLRESGHEYDKWWAAIHLLSKQDHYILVMVRQAALRPRGDRLKLLGTGIAFAGLFICIVFLRIYLQGRYGINFSRYIPSRDTREFLWWAIPASLVIVYWSLRILLGSTRTYDIVTKALKGLVRTANRLK